MPSRSVLKYMDFETSLIIFAFAQEWSKKTHRLMQQKDEKVHSLLADIESTQEMHKRNFERHLQVLDFAISKSNVYIVMRVDIFSIFKECKLSSLQCLMGAINVLLNQLFLVKNLKILN